MSEFTSVTGVTGTDGKVPLWNPEGRWAIWNKKEIYFGKEGEGRYVPKVGDLVLDQDFWVWYEVIAIDESTKIPTLVQKNTTVSSGEFSEADILFGVGPGTQADTYRAYVDQSVVPYVLAVDARLRVNGTMISFCKIFRGSDLVEANAVSALYDASNSFVGTSIPLELVSTTGNISTKCVPPCKTRQDLEDGEIVSAVFYSDSGHVVSKRQLLVENTAFIRSTDASVKYITGISLKSPFLSNSDVDLIQYPINVPLQSMNLMGVVEYSDGSSIELPVDGTKFQVFGFDNFVSTVVGQEISVVLKYNLSADEIAYGTGIVSNERFMNKSYKARVLKADGAYSVKLFGYPYWVDAITGWRMEWFLYNLDRNINQRVTPYVRVNENGAPFDPLAYGVTQALNVAINLKDANNSYKAYRHVQTLNVALIRPGTENGTTFMVGFDPGQNPLFGAGQEFTYEFSNENLKDLDLSLGAVTLDKWLEKLYWPTKPLTNPYVELEAPIPTHFAVVIGTERYEYPIDQWAGTITVGQELKPGNTVFIQFFKRTPSNDIQLAVAGLSAKQRIAD